MRILLLLFVSLLASAQSVTRVFFVQRAVTGTLNRITIQQASSAPRAIRAEGFFFSCTVACSPLITDGGTLSGGSPGTILKYDKRSPSASASATLDGTIGGSPETVFSRDLVANGERSHSGGLFLPAVAGSQSQLNAEITSGSSGLLYIQVVYSEP